MGFKSQADIDAAYQSGYTDGQAAGVTIHTGTKSITTNGTTDLGEEHTYRYINTAVPGAQSTSVPLILFYSSYFYLPNNCKSYNCQYNSGSNFAVTYNYSGGMYSVTFNTTYPNNGKSAYLFIGVNNPNEQVGLTITMYF